jgi:hypothetical protein
VWISHSHGPVGCSRRALLRVVTELSHTDGTFSFSIRALLRGVTELSHSDGTFSFPIRALLHGVTELSHSRLVLKTPNMEQSTTQRSVFALYFKRIKILATFRVPQLIFEFLLQKIKHTCVTFLTFFMAQTAVSDHPFSTISFILHKIRHICVTVRNIPYGTDCCPDRPFSIVLVILHISGRLLQPQNGDAPCYDSKPPCTINDAKRHEY